LCTYPESGGGVGVPFASTVVSSAETGRPFLQENLQSLPSIGMFRAAGEFMSLRLELKFEGGFEGVGQQFLTGGEGMEWTGGDLRFIRLMRTSLSFTYFSPAFDMELK
jgi:hypothetical protein